MTPAGNRPTISYFDVFPLLAASCPSFPHSHDADGADPDLGEFLMITRLVEHLVHLLHEDRVESFPAVFGMVERILIDGDDEARSLIVEGFLDDLVDPDLYTETTRRPDDFVTWLGPVARRHGTPPIDL